MIEYVLTNYEGKESRFSYKHRELVELYNEFVSMTDEEFLDNLPRAIHFACIVCFIKEVSPINSVGDFGVIHELAHLNSCQGKDLSLCTTTSLEDIRKLFNRVLLMPY